VAETDHYVVIDKPPLIDSQDSRPGRPSVVDWLRERHGFAGLVHRLDFGTSGLMVCAKSASAARELTEALQGGRIGRTYWAVVMGQNLPDQGVLDSALDEQQAATRYRVLERFANAALLEIELETGRKHQIRRHFAGAGHPLLGDRLYGKGGSERLFARPALHARALRVLSRSYEAELPADLRELIARLRSRRS
jgi:23S rRNA-/tRNA-specific pseudouridylate synthase